jgi:hypothetical protein
MITARDLRARLTWPVASLSVLDIAAAVILSAHAVALTSGVVHTSHSHVLRLDTTGGSTEAPSGFSYLASIRCPFECRFRMAQMPPISWATRHKLASGLTRLLTRRPTH